MDANDHELLQFYVCDGSQAAFTELVHRHVALVFSAARRQVQSHDLAKDVTQLVFISLARHGHRMSRHTPVSAWLYLVTRRTSLNLLRTDARRRAREQTAAEIAVMKSSTSDWSRIESCLDELMATLGKADGTALVLRFFDNKSLREVGAALGISEDAAQKRVDRALDRLREGFARRGIVLGAAGLVTQLSTHAIEAVPPGIGASVAAASLATIPAAGGILATVKTLVMTTVQKQALGAALALAAGLVLCEGSSLWRARAAANAARALDTDRESELTRLRTAREAADARLASVEHEINARLAATRDPDAATLAAIDSRLVQLDRIDRFFATHPELAIPELAWVSRSQWNNIVSRASTNSEDDLRRLASELRRAGQSVVAAALSGALSQYLHAHGGELPDSPAQLAPFLSSAPWRAARAPEILDRYEMLRPRGSVGPPLGFVSVPRQPESMPVIGSKFVADVEHDQLWWAAPRASGIQPAMVYDLRLAQQRFAAANDGQPATRAEQIAPYLKWPLAAPVLQKYWDLSYGRSREPGSFEFPR